MGYEVDLLPNQLFWEAMFFKKLCSLFMLLIKIRGIWK